MNHKISIRLRLAELLEEKRVTPEELAVAARLPFLKIQRYCDGNVDSISLTEMGIILSALGCSQITDILEEVADSMFLYRGCLYACGGAAQAGRHYID